jgi:hypothetical protein
MARWKDVAVRDCTFKVIPVLSACLLITFITVVLVYSLYIHEPVPVGAVISVSVLFGLFLLLFILGYAHTYIKKVKADCNEADVENPAVSRAPQEPSELLTYPPPVESQDRREPQQGQRQYTAYRPLSLGSPFRPQHELPATSFAARASRAEATKQESLLPAVVPRNGSGQTIGRKQAGRTAVVSADSRILDHSIVPSALSLPLQRALDHNPGRVTYGSPTRRGGHGGNSSHVVLGISSRASEVNGEFSKRAGSGIPKRQRRRLKHGNRMLDKNPVSECGSGEEARMNPISAMWRTGLMMGYVMKMMKGLKFGACMYIQKRKVDLFVWKKRQRNPARVHAVSILLRHVVRCVKLRQGVYLPNIYALGQALVGDTIRGVRG